MVQQNKPATVHQHPSGDVLEKVQQHGVSTLSEMPDDPAMTQASATYSIAATKNSNNSSPPSPVSKDVWLSICHRSAQPFDPSPSHKVMWDVTQTTENDQCRWVGQGIHFRSTPDSTGTTTRISGQNFTLDQLAESHKDWGLQQEHGGPCGVLAAVQAELLRHLLYQDRDDTDDFHAALYQQDPFTVSLAYAIGTILARAAITPIAGSSNDSTERQSMSSLAAYIVLPKRIREAHPGLIWDDLEPWPNSAVNAHTKSDTPLACYKVTAPSIPSLDGDDQNSKRQRTYSSDDGKTTSPGPLSRATQRLTKAIVDFLLAPLPAPTSCTPLHLFQLDGGVMLFVLSILQTRGDVTTEFDDKNAKLTAQFGHCSQELINLLLTGRAVSNVFDNNVSLGPEMLCRGISDRPSIGYLSQLEALRYCQVGDYYKSPLHPIWVVGSTSHFSVLVAEDQALEESSSDKLLEQCRRAFKTVPMAEEQGFIPTSSLESVLSELGLSIGEGGTAALAAAIEIKGADIIIFDEFWKAASRLLTGASLESVLAGSDDALSTNHATAANNTISTILSSAQEQMMSSTESDEALARRLAEEWDKEDAAVQNSTNTTTSLSFSNMSDLNAATSNQFGGTFAGGDGPDTAMTDEELARKLQAEWDTEASDAVSNEGVASVRSDTSMTMYDDSANNNNNNNDSNNNVDSNDGGIGDDNNDDDAKPAATTSSHEFERYGDTFSLYHYNGLRGGTLTPFRATRLTAEEAVGTSIALHREGHAPSSASGSGDLEDVIRTKWPAAMMNWLGKPPPYID